MSLGVGDTAPDFTLPGTGGSDYSLATTPASRSCSSSIRATTRRSAPSSSTRYNDDLGQFDGVGAQVLAICPQASRATRRSPAKHGFDFPLLADTDKKVAGAYGTLGPLGFPRRSVFVVDADGVIRYAHRAIAGLTYRPRRARRGCRAAAGWRPVRAADRRFRTARRSSVRSGALRRRPHAAHSRARRSTPRTGG